MQFKTLQPLSTLVITGGAHWLEIGSVQTRLVVVGLFVVTLVIAAIMPGVGFLARLSKWILALISSWLLIAEAIFTFGSPLAGVIYWSSCTFAAIVLLPLVAILLTIGLLRGQPLQFFLPQIAVCILLGIVCFVTA